MPSLGRLRLDHRRSWLPRRVGHSARPVVVAPAPPAPASPGHRGPRADCGHGREAVFAGYREKVIDTVPGPVALRRAWYHCADCGHGLAPRDDELGVAGTSMSPGLAAMNDLAAAAGPVAGSALLPIA